MGKNEVIGSIEVLQLPEGVQIKWKIADFSSIDQAKDYDSPTFSFEGNSWYFDLWHPCALQYPDIVYLNLNNDETREYSVEYNFCFKKLDNSVEQIGSGIMGEEKKYIFPKDSIRLPEIIERKSELLLSDTLTIVCSLKRKEMTEHFIQPTGLSGSQPQHEVLIKLDTLSQNFKDAYANQESCDTTLSVKDREYRVHRLVLIARSSVFAAMFRHDTKEKETNIVTIPDCDPESFGKFLKFLYCGKLDEISFCSALHLYVTSDKYNVQELKAFCIEYMIENLTVENLK